ncbi:AAA family ATPase [Ktedonobacter racemifer]|uniref:Deoxynucleoside kinase domain-containing protein n=1 Tax=Ktedonobacter racemifer DSM 44963 TaxID=485913 RepID=D6TFP3_KTERA|nr:AAA family ATPase [Ktedonobacter racemifer]EFH90526.1 hypothetical protein Krac_12149 [Ktedonobacter racemifer DSM 44963]
MAAKVFVLGRPGSGKTTAVRHMHELYSRMGGEARRVRDYEILYEMFLNDQKEHLGRFQQSAYCGFDVLDMAVVDEALMTLEKSIKKILNTRVDYANEHSLNELITIEFARDNYQQALKNFDKAFLQDAYFFFVEADLETCMRRIRQRITFPMDGERPVDDCHYVSDYIMQTYYHKDCEEYVLEQLASDFALDPGKIIMCRNEGSLDALLKRVDRFMEQLVSDVAPLSVVGTK